MTAFSHSFNSMQVTVSLLPVSLSLVHIPRSRLAQLSHPVLKQILQPSPTFLNITCNEIELSLFAEHRVLADFELIARDDRRRQRSRSGSGSSRKNISRSCLEPVEISYERWNVLQIDSHADQIDNAGARVHELSAPLAEAGISILYQSSYMSDFIMVKESRLQEVMTLLGSTGFDLYSSEPNPLAPQMVSPALSPVSADDFSSEMDLGANITTESGAVLTRARSSTDTSMSALASVLQQTRVTSETVPAPPSLVETVQTPSRSKSHSPTSGEVRVLIPDLACVGLSDDNVENWSLKILKLVAFPELIPAANIPRSETTGQEDWYAGFSTAHSVAGGQHPLFEPFTTISTPPDRGRREISPSSSSSSSGEDGYFSHSPTGDNSNTSLATSRSYPDLTKSSTSMGPSFRPMTKRLITPLLPIDPVADALGFDSSGTGDVKIPSSSRQSAVGFFSFTRTSEGSSLTTDVSLLASLFPPDERHMVICSGELDSVENAADVEVDDDDDENSEGILKCLQIDLRRFGLDKHGLVNRFSQVLEENGINHMYSSTFKTANLLVGKRHAARAQSLLRSC